MQPSRSLHAWPIGHGGGCSFLPHKVRGTEYSVHDGTVQAGNVSLAEGSGCGIQPVGPVQEKHVGDNIIGTEANIYAPRNSFC